MSKKNIDYDGMDNQGRFTPEREYFHIKAWKTVDWIIKGIVYMFLATGSLEDIEIMDVVARVMLLIIIVLLFML
tara:strand:+ start:417 stop:638 length:222 start_codon:yes stop_codon:yes gene_type:complete